MVNNILAILEEKAPCFSKGQKRIARYLLTNLQKAAFMTAAALGKETQVSESTVVRFAAELGYEGFPQMQKALQDAFVGHYEEDRIPNIQMKNIDDAARAITAARRIYLIANGIEKMLADYMGTCLESRFADVHVLTAESGKISHVGAEDIAVVFCCCDDRKDTEKMAAYCRNTGAKVIGITSSERAPICTYCDLCLFADTERKPYGISLSKPMMLVEEILNAVTSGKDGGKDEI